MEEGEDEEGDDDEAGKVPRRGEATNPTTRLRNRARKLRKVLTDLGGRTTNSLPGRKSNRRRPEIITGMARRCRVYSKPGGLRFLARRRRRLVAERIARIFSRHMYNVRITTCNFYRDRVYMISDMMISRPFEAVDGSNPPGAILKYDVSKFRIQEDRRGALEICGIAIILSLAGRNGREICTSMPMLFGPGGKDWRRILSAIGSAGCDPPRLTQGGGGFSFVFLPLTAPGGTANRQNPGNHAP